MMKLAFFILLSLFSNCFGGSFGPYDYHNLVGVPKARALKATEFGASLRIVGGTQVSSISVIPYQAGIVVTLKNGETSICGGSLISDTRVLTAAHCWWDGERQATQFTIVLGSLTIFSGGTRVVTKDVVVHPSWNVNAILNDIAVAKISKVSYNTNIQAIALPTNANQIYAGVSGTVSGYGKRSDNQNSFPSSTSLYQTTVNTITNAVCQNTINMKLDASHLCTSGQGGKGTCDGDSGGPLTVVESNQRVLVGIVSFGLDEGCQSGLPSVFTRVTSFLTWIKSNM